MATSKAAEWKGIMWNRPFRLLRALKLAWALVRKPWDEKTEDPWDNIDLRCAWDVAHGIYLAERPSHD